MRKFFIVILLSISSVALAANSTVSDTRVANKADKAITAANPVDSSKYILVFADPKNDAKITEKLDPTHLLIPIFRQDGWLKVGNPDNGNVGWINVDQYRKILADFYKSKVQTLYTQTIAISPDKEGKTVVYENGKQVDDKRAQEIIKQMNVQLKDQQERMAKFNENMQKMFDESMQNFNKAMMDMPTIVITPPK
jgi:uncharacterized coiled-coil protein SlyX